MYIIIEPLFGRRELEERERTHFHSLEEQRKRRPNICGPHGYSSSPLDSEEMQKKPQLFCFQRCARGK